MKKVILVIFLILLAGCGSENPSQIPIVKEGIYQTFVIEHNTPLSPIRELQKNTAERRKQNMESIEQEEKTDECIKALTKNWRRVRDNKATPGFDKELDFDLRWKIKNDIIDDKNGYC